MHNENLRKRKNEQTEKCRNEEMLHEDMNRRRNAWAKKTTYEIVNMRNNEQTKKYTSEEMRNEKNVLTKKSMYE